MKRTLLTVIAVLMLALSGTTAVSATQSDKVLVCHAAGLDGTTHYVTLSVPATETGFPQGHFTEEGTQAAGHEDDYLGACIEEEPSSAPSTTPSAQPSDEPSSEPSAGPSSPPSAKPSNAPSVTPSTQSNETPVSTPSSPSTTPPPTDTASEAGVSGSDLTIIGLFAIGAFWLTMALLRKPRRKS